MIPAAIEPDSCRNAVAISLTGGIKSPCRRYLLILQYNMTGGAKNKIGFFAIGLVAGISVGVVFGYAIKEGLARLNFLHLSLNEIDTRQSQISMRLDTIESKLSKKDAQPKHAAVAVAPKPMAAGEKRNKDTDGVKPVDRQDAPGLTTGDSNVVVMTDQMVGYRTVAFTNLDSSMRSSAAKVSDSLIGELNDEAPQGDNSSYRVEFWESPINLKGYKMSIGKLILFGINSTEPVKIVRYNGTVYIITGQETYKAQFTDDFRPYEKVTDKNLIKRLRG